MYYIDSNILIFHFIKDRIVGEECRRILEKISNGEIEAVSSVHLLNEVYATIRMITRNENKAIKLAMKSLEFGIRFYNLPLEFFTDIVEINKKFGLKWGDCIHYSTMKKFKLKEIISDDTGFDRVKTIKRIDPRKIDPDKL